MSSLPPILAILLTLAFLGVIVRGQRRFPVLQYLFFARFPLVSAAILVALPFLAVYGWKSLLGNLFVLGTLGDLAAVTLFVALACWMVMATLLLILTSAPARFAVEALRVPLWVRRFRAPLALLLGVPTVAVALLGSEVEAGLAQHLGAVALGLAAAWLLRLLGLYLQKPLARRLGRTGRGGLGQGYELKVRKGNLAGTANGEPKPGDTFTHLHAASFFLVIFAVYWAGYFLLAPRPAGPLWSLPALCYLLLLIMVFGWALPGISFFLDRFRVPTLLVIALVAFLSSLGGDHYYEVLSRPAAGGPAARLEAETPEAAILEPLEDEDVPQVVVVTASGGGIAAAVWTAKVLTQLHHQVQLQTGDPGRESPFARSLGLISAVSGGSVGAMFYADAFSAGPPSREDLDRAVAGAGAGSLEATAWGILYPDLARGFGVLAPLLPGLSPLQDRGWALEQAWRRRLQDPEATLRSWSPKATSTWRPPLVFNATTVETGERFLLSNLQWPAAEVGGSGGSRRLPGCRTFFETYDTPGVERDLELVTAARLSATFPYVTPVARPSSRDERLSPGFHLADGGYYDNLGVVSALEWLRRTLDGPRDSSRPRRVLFVRIRSLEPSAEEEDEIFRDLEKSRGWIYSTLGPVLTLLRVRGPSQGQRADLEVELLARAFGDQVEIVTVTFSLRDGSPLSWQLSRAQEREIHQHWQNSANQRALERVLAFFAEP